MSDERAVVTIRPARPEDAEAVAAMVRALSAHEREPAPGFTAEHFRRYAFGLDAVYQTFIAEAAGEPVGMVAFHGGFVSQSGESGLWVIDLYVVEAWRRQGVGVQLLAAVGQAARQRGGSWARWMVRRDNPLALAFYRGIGAKRDEDLTMYLRGPRLDRFLTRALRPGP